MQHSQRLVKRVKATQKAHDAARKSCDTRAMWHGLMSTDAGAMEKHLARQKLLQRKQKL